MLNELVTPVPELFRDVAKHKIAGKIGELAFKEMREAISEELVIKDIFWRPRRGIINSSEKTG